MKRQFILANTFASTLLARIIKVKQIDYGFSCIVILMDTLKTMGRNFICLLNIIKTVLYLGYFIKLATK